MLMLKSESLNIRKNIVHLIIKTTKNDVNIKTREQKDESQVGLESITMKKRDYVVIKTI